MFDVGRIGIGGFNFGPVWELGAVFSFGATFVPPLPLFPTFPAFNRLSLGSGIFGSPAFFGFGGNSYSNDLLRAGSIISGWGNAITDTDPFRWGWGGAGVYNLMDPLSWPMPQLWWPFGSQDTSQGTNTSSSGTTPHSSSAPFATLSPAYVAPTATTDEKASSAGSTEPATSSGGSGSSTIAYLENTPVGTFDKGGLKGNFYKIRKNIGKSSLSLVLVTSDNKVLEAKIDSGGAQKVVTPHKHIGNFMDNGRDKKIVKK